MLVRSPIARDAHSRRLRRLVRFVPLASLVLLQSRAAFGLPTAPGDAADEVASRSLLERIGLDGAVEWLDGEENERLLAISRLAAAPNPRALRLLDRWLEDSSHWSSQELWTVAQALAPRAEDPIAQRWLFRILTGATPREKEALPRWSPLVEMAQQVAALGLAASGDANATSLLAKLLRRQTPASKIASAALLAHPPDHLGPLLTSPGAPTVLLVQTLERLGDQRAFSTLREFVRRGAPEIQAAAAVALLRLGHLETVELAEHWLEHRREPLAIVAATAEILLASQAPNAETAFERLLELAPERALNLLQRHPHPKAVDRLAEAWSGLPETAREAALAALGRAPTPAARRVLASELKHPPRANVAAMALAQSPAAAAGKLLGQAMAHPSTRILAVRALVLRASLGLAVPRELWRQLEQLRQSSEPVAAYVGVWGRSALDERFAIEQVLSGDAEAMRAATSTALRHSPNFLRACAKSLSRWDGSPALSVALLDEQAARLVPTSQLLEWAQLPSPLRLVAVSQLARRDDPRQEARIQQFVEAPDLGLRAAAYLGFGKHPTPQKTASLVQALQTETEASVRQAVIVALSQRPRHQIPPQVFPDAARIDPDPDVRALARLAMNGAELSAVPTGTEAAWLQTPTAPALRGALLLAPGLLPVYLTAAPDGELPLVGLRHERFRVRPVVGQRE